MVRKRSVDRERVVQTAITIIDADGPDRLTLARVAGELGIRIPSLYNHVAGLDGLHRELALWGVQTLGDRLRRAVTGRAGADAVTELAHAYRCFAHEHPGVYALTLRAPDPDDPEMNAASDEVVGVVLAVLRPYALSDADTLHTVRILRSLLHGFVHLEIVGGFGLPLERDETFRRLIDRFIVSLDAGLS